MGWIDERNEASAYVEARLTEDFDFKRLSRLAGGSAFHFRRMFAYMAGVPLSEYVRRRRMTLAGRTCRRR